MEVSFFNPCPASTLTRPFPAYNGPRSVLLARIPCRSCRKTRENSISSHLKNRNIYRGYEGRSRGVDSLIQRKTDEEKNESGEIIRVRLPQKRNREMFAQAELMMGANHIRVKCYDGVTRMGRIKGKIKKKVWIREGDILVVIPWSFQDDKCDIIYRYTGPQVEWLRRNGYL